MRGKVATGGSSSSAGVESVFRVEGVSNPASQRFKRVSSSEGVESVFEECAWKQGGKRLKRVAHKQLILQQGLVVNLLHFSVTNVSSFNMSEYKDQSSVI